MGKKVRDEASGSGMPMCGHKAVKKPRRIAEERSLDVREIVHSVVLKIQRCADRCAFARARGHVSVIRMKVAQK
ncbi:hypothetical protein VZT92_000328 [Zoarces viviparus]|uniref:Uncharacterized protein n=1 Tax=Zoarces viviparus TaxID=48416 RepID=A0AAW1G6S7_ZOAVI